MPSGNPQRTAEDRERARAERERRRQAKNGKPPQQPAPLEPDLREHDAAPAPLENAAASAISEEATAPALSESAAVHALSVGTAGPASAADAGEPVEGGESIDREEPVDEGEPIDWEEPVAGAAGPIVGAEQEPLAASAAEAEPPALASQQLAIPKPAPLPPRISPPDTFGRAATSNSKRWPARLGVGVGLVLAALGAVAIVLHNRSHSEKPPPPVSVVRVTIPEGETRAQIAQIAASKGLRGSYLKASRYSGLLNPVHYGAPHATHTLEGFLFPDTYELFTGASTRHLVELQLAAFHENFTSSLGARARALHITPYELLIVASMVEREALLARDRPRVAAVIYNRLRLGMPLGIDSTIRYALHDYTKPLTEAQLQIDSPYNTRTHKGLPPTPISNPGLAAIDAAAHPAHVSYLYYVNGADGCGELVFSTENAQFERDAAAYREAIAHNGGRVPTCRKR